MNSNFFNLSKRKKRNVLEELLSGSLSNGMVSKKELSALNKLIGDTVQVDSTSKKKSAKPKKTPAGKKQKATLKKATYYLPGDVYKSLDSAEKEIKSILPQKLRKSISKSEIVNQALFLILKDFEAKGKNSSLVRNIINKS